jgi:glycosyltransferase involved in cell wall biosynthesis
MRITAITEEISSRPETGMLVFQMYMFRYLSSRHDLQVLYESGEPDPQLSSRRILKGRFLLSRELTGAIDLWKPDLLIYTPASGLTGSGMLRSVLLKRSSGKPVVVLTLQSPDTGRIHRAVSLWSAPDLVLSPVREIRQALDALRINTDFIMPGYDPLLFRPAEAGRKMELRARYGIPGDRYVILHVGHLRESRNLQAFLRYRDWGPDIQPVVKAGEVEPVWRDHLRQAGVIVIDEYTDAIHEIYQTADLYLFPVSFKKGELEFPLSVIEACACDLPVLTTRFGALPEVLDDGDGLEWFSGVAEIPGKLSTLRKGGVNTRAKVIDLSWDRMFDRYLAPHLKILATLPSAKEKGSSP